MEIKVYLKDGKVVEADGNVDAMGVHYPHNTSGLVVPGKENEMRIVMIPWLSITKLEYVITPEMVAPEPNGPVPIMSAGDVGIVNPLEVRPNSPNRKQRRAGLQG